MQELYTVHATVKNTVYPFHLDACTVKIYVNDVNDFPPSFSDGNSVNLVITENSPIGRSFVHFNFKY